MGRFRALKPLQASSLGLVQPGMEFDWDGNIIGWHVEPLDDAARAMVEERAKRLGDKGAAAAEKPLPTQPFPKSVMKASAGMTAPQVMADTFGIDKTPAPDASAPNMSAPPRRRKAG